MKKFAADGHGYNAFCVCVFSNIVKIYLRKFIDEKTGNKCIRCAIAFLPFLFYRHATCSMGVCSGVEGP